MVWIRIGRENLVRKIRKFLLGRIPTNGKLTVHLKADSGDPFKEHSESVFLSFLAHEMAEK